MNHTYLLTGGNLGDRLANLQRAKSLLEAKAGELIKSSAVYETAAWGNTEQPAFLNQVLLINSFLDPQQLLKTILSIEQMLGRRRLEKMGPRTIDIDILFYNDLILKTPSLTIPHPHLQDRKFVLKPLADIAPSLVHPLLQKNIATLLEECTDTLEVKPYS